ncbi:MAG: hypothetical protein NVS3B18_05810 [Candidatus Dormibacteria bacterium]
MLFVVIVAGLLRLGVGLLQPPEADEATLGVAALRITHGHLILMESNAHYLGALGAYIAAPFVGILGSGTPALRLAMSLVGAGYVLLMYALGRAVFASHAGGLRAAAVAAVLPLFAVLFTVRALWAYGEILPLEALLLLITIRIAWLGHGRRRDWAEVGMWTTPLLAIVLAPCVLALLLRAQLVGWRSSGRGAVFAAAGGLGGYSPWLAYNVAHHAASLHSLVGDRAGRLATARQLLNAAIPILTGAVRTCGAPRTVWSAVAVLGVAALFVVVVASRYHVLRQMLGGRASAAEPIDLVLLVAPLSVGSLVLSGFNVVPCEPRYLLPLSVPLAISAAAALGHWRLPASSLLVAWLVVESVSVVRTPQVGAATSTGVPVPAEVAELAPALERRHLEAIYADYWLERPLLYASDQRLVMGEYNGFVGFPGIQAAADRAEHPSWLFVAGDPLRLELEAACRERGVTYRRSELGGLVLYAALSRPVRPADLRLVVDQSRYPVGPASEDTAGPDPATG